MQKNYKIKVYYLSVHVNIVQLVDTQVHRDYQRIKISVTNKDRVEYLGKLLNNVKQSGNTLILVDRISAGEMLQELIPDSICKKGDVKLKDRKEAYDEINEGTNPWLLLRMVLRRWELIFHF